MATDEKNDKSAASAAADDAAGKQAAQMRELHRRLGEVVELMAFSRSHELLFLADLKWAVLPPLGLQQYRLVRDKSGQVVAYVSWAWVDEEVAARLAQGRTKLRPKEWRCGEQAVIVDMLSGANGEAAQNKILSELKEKVFSGKTLKALRWNADKRQFELQEV